MIRHLIGIGLFSLLGAPTLAAQPATPALDTARIEQLTGAKGSLEAKDGVFKVSVPRSDLSVNAAGVKLTPPLGLTSWAAFKRMGKHTAVMGDLVLLEDQVNPVMSAALDNGFEAVPRADIGPARTTLDTKKIDTVLGRSGELNAGVYKVTIGRETRMHGETMGNAMGVNTWAAFVGSDESAVVDGDFAALDPTETKLGAR